jgi:hypothetical protein
VEGEAMKTLVSITFNGASSEHIFDVPKNEFEIIWNEHIANVGYFEGVDMEGRTVIINPKQCPVIVMYDLKD